MSDTSKRNNPVAAYEVVQVENDKLKLIEGRYALSKDELSNLEGMIITATNHTVVRDPKTGKILRIKDNRTINEVIDDKHKKIIERKLKEQKEKISEGR